MCQIRHIGEDGGSADPATAAALLNRRSLCEHGLMITFEEFVESLGDFAKNYTDAELRQLHLEVHRFAQIIIAINRRNYRNRARSPQPGVDADGQDHIVETDALS